MGVLDVVGWVFVVIGGLFMSLGGLGLLRMPDVYNRAQASTKTTSLGLLSISVGVAFIEPSLAPKALLVGVFTLLTNPVASHALVRASVRAGVPLWQGSVFNAYEEFLKKEGKDE